MFYGIYFYMEVMEIGIWKNGILSFLVVVGNNSGNFLLDGS
jgi:hypothetical protein